MDTHFRGNCGRGRLSLGGLLLAISYDGDSSAYLGAPSIAAEIEVEGG